jgi:hypothetical protein
MTLSPEVKELLTDPEAIWQALSIDGVSYPFDSTLHGRNRGERMEIAEKIKIFDDERALMIGDLILEHRKELESSEMTQAMMTDAIIGSTVRKQIERHLEKIAESK